MFPQPKVEESEAWNRAAFDSLGQKQRVFEPSSLSDNFFYHGKWSIYPLPLIIGAKKYLG